MERDLLLKAKIGDKEALIQLIMLRQDDYYRLAFAYLKNKNDALDAMQEMIIIIYENVKGLKNDNAFPSWSKAVLINVCKKILKRKKKYFLLENMEEVEPIANKDNSTSMATKMDINHYLNKLNDKQKDAIILKYYLDLDYDAISEMTKTPVGTVKSRVFNGLKKLNQLLGGTYNG